MLKHAEMDKDIHARLAATVKGIHVHADGVTDDCGEPSFCVSVVIERKQYLWKQFLGPGGDSPAEYYRDKLLEVIRAVEALAVKGAKVVSCGLDNEATNKKVEALFKVGNYCDWGSER